MCGICGYSGGRVNGRLEKMNALLAHRGPDGQGTYHDRDHLMNLGHRRLSIIDLEGGEQPMSNEDGTVWVVFNGEIYNYRELRRELESKGHRFQSASDTETLVHLYEDDGPDLAGRLNGMFAFALWDSRRKRLLLARDRLGVKPLYWAMINDRLVFASEIKSILCWPGMNREIDHRALSYYLSLRNVPAPLTIFQSIQALPPAHLLTWRPGPAPRLQRYWSLDFTPRSRPDEHELSDALEDLLLDATRIRLRADVPVGAYLSGGLDSSLVVGMMRRFETSRLHTFCLGYNDRPRDKNDRHYARMLAQKYDTTHHEYMMSASDLSRALPEMTRFLDQPFAGVVSSFFLTSLVTKYVKVVLTGDGADDQFGSYGHHRLVWPLFRLAQARKKGYDDPYAAADLQPLADRPDEIRRFDGLDFCQLRARFGAFPDDDKVRVLHPDYQFITKEYPVMPFLENLWRQSTALDPLNRMLDLDIQTLLPNEILFYADRLSMAHSVETRSPFLDYRVVELAASIPGSLKIKGAVLKYILRKTAERYLPRDILDRPKEGFVLPKHIWLRGRLDGLLRECLSPERLAAAGFFDERAVQALIREHQQGRRDHAFRIWALVMFQTWHREFMEDPVWP